MKSDTRTGLEACGAGTAVGDARALRRRRTRAPAPAAHSAAAHTAPPAIHPVLSASEIQNNPIKNYIND